MKADFIPAKSPPLKIAVNVRQPECVTATEASLNWTNLTKFLVSPFLFHWIPTCCGFLKKPGIVVESSQAAQASANGGLTERQTDLESWCQACGMNGRMCGGCMGKRAALVLHAVSEQMGWRAGGWCQTQRGQRGFARCLPPCWRATCFLAARQSLGA